MTKAQDDIFIAVFKNELQRYRLIVGAKREGDTMKDFLENRAPEIIKLDISKESDDPINKFDKVSTYSHLLSSDFSVAKAKKVRAIKDDYEPKTSLENMISYLQDNNYVIYKRKTK